MRLAFIVPGLLASELESSTGNLFSSPKVWVNDTRLFLAGPDILKLGSDGASPVGQFPRLGITGRTVQNRMAPLRRALEGDGFTVTTFCYDWRKSIDIAAAALANSLAAALQSSPDAERIVVVGHSMGGLIARLAYPLCSAAVQAKWNASVYLGTPFGGSYQAAEAMGTKAVFLNLFWGDQAARSALTYFSRGDVTRLVDMARTWPSLYQLFPPQGASAFSALDPDVAKLYDPTNYPRDVSMMAAWMAKADEIHTSLAGVATRPAKEVAVVGTGIRTLDTAHPDHQVTHGVSSYGFEEMSDWLGDGVVHSTRASLAGMAVVSMPNATHVGMTSDQRVLDTVLSNLDEYVADEEVVQDPVRQPTVNDGGRRIPLPPAGNNLIVPLFWPPSPVGGQDRLIRHGDP